MTKQINYSLLFIGKTRNILVKKYYQTLIQL